MYKCARLATDSEAKTPILVITAKYLLLHLGGELLNILFCCSGYTFLLKPVVAFPFTVLTRAFL